MVFGPKEEEEEEDDEEDEWFKLDCPPRVLALVVAILPELLPFSKSADLVPLDEDI